MINETILKMLNKNAFGADINRLSLYVHYYKEAYNITNTLSDINELKVYENIITELCSVPNISNKRSIENNKYCFYGDNIYFDNNNILNENSEEVLDIISYIDNRDFSLICIPNIIGIYTKCIYINGRLYKILFGNNAVDYFDVTNVLKSKVPDYVEELKECTNVVLYGKTILKSNCDRYLKNDECTIMYYVNNNIHIDELAILLTDILGINDEYNVDTHWDRIKLIRNLNFMVPHHALLRDISSDTFISAMYSFDDHFVNEYKNQQIIYRYDGFEIRDNTDIRYTNNIRLLFDVNRLSGTFTSKIKSFLYINEGTSIKIKANILKIEQGNTKIETIDIDDISLLSELGLHVGGNITFTVENSNIKIVR